MKKKILLIHGEGHGALYGAALGPVLEEMGFEAALKPVKETGGAEGAGCLLLMDEQALEDGSLKGAKEGGQVVIYYGGFSGGSPDERVIRRAAGKLDLALSQTPAEQAAFEKAGVRAEFAGHPLVDIMSSPLSLREAKEAIGYDWTELPVSIVSSPEFDETLMRVMFEGAAEAAAVSTRKVRLVVPDAERYTEGLVNDLVKISPKRIKVLEGQRREALLASEAAVVAAGPATLEAALGGAHVLAVKKSSFFSSLLGGLGGGQKSVSLPNKLLGRPLCPELTGRDAAPRRITQELAGLVESSTKDEINAGLDELRGMLGKGAALRRAAEAVARALGAG
jgi:lipid-A-disaccharide synthase